MSIGMNGIIAATCFWFVAAFASADAYMAKRTKGVAPVTSFMEETKPKDDDAMTHSLLSGADSEII